MSRGVGSGVGRRDVEVCVVGAGPHALAVVTHLVAARPSLRHGLAVIEPSGEWLRVWRTQFDRLQIDVLRSPIVHHPAVDPGALAHYVTDARLPRSNLPYDPPLADAFDSFCDATIQREHLDGLPAAARVVALGTGADGATAVTTDAGTFTAESVVWTGNTARRVVPAVLDDAVTSSPFVQHAADVDLRGLDSLAGDHVVVVGGSLTAGHLVVGARSRGAHVTLVTRRSIVERDFDVEPGWLGPRFLDGFWRLRQPEQRLRAARTARGGGSMPGWMHRRLRAEIDAGHLTHLVGAVTGADHDDAGVSITVDNRTVDADRCWLATGTHPDARADHALAGSIDHHVDGIPIVEPDLRVPDTNLFVTGRLATLELGPAAGNLWGARMAARRICAAITGVELDADSTAVVVPPAEPTRPMEQQR